MTFDAYAQSLGISFVPVDRGTKRPRPEHWTDPERVFVAEDFNAGDNCGGRWGQPSGGIVDIDCDSQFAARLAHRVIVNAPRYGRPGNPHSHYLVRSEGATTKKYIDPLTKRMLLELRSTGTQSVLPPSVHPSGGCYEWERQGQPPTIPPAELLSNLGELAAAALVASRWSKGTRHTFAMALAGFLATNGAPRERAVRFVRFVVIAAQDEEEQDRLAAVATTYERYSNGEAVTSSFKSVLSDEGENKTVAKTLLDWLGLGRSPFRIHNEQTLLQRPAAAFLAKDRIVAGSLVTMISPPDIGKTFLALDLCLSVAAGRTTWLNTPLLQSGSVVYVVAEGTPSRRPRATTDCLRVWRCRYPRTSAQATCEGQKI